jgi:hypothetical protein
MVLLSSNKVSILFYFIITFTQFDDELDQASDMP